MSGFLDKIKHLLRGKPDQGPDLFEYAAVSAVTRPAPDGHKKSRFWLALLFLGAAALSFFLGHTLGRKSCDISNDQPLPEEKPAPAEGEKKPLPEDAKRFLGYYMVETGGHRAQLYIYDTGLGYAGAAIRFTNWGRHVPEYPALSLAGNQIYFLRSCEGSRCAEIGAQSALRQEYFGTLSPDAMKIEGNYKGNQSSGLWTAVRVP